MTPGNLRSIAYFSCGTETASKEALKEKQTMLKDQQKCRRSVWLIHYLSRNPVLVCNSKIDHNSIFYSR